MKQVGQSTPAFSIPVAPEHRLEYTQNVTPAPNAYKPELPDIKRKLKVRFPREDIPDLFPPSEVPGVGSYSLRKKFMKRISQKLLYKIANSKDNIERFKIEENENPGPGSYEQNQVNKTRIPVGLGFKAERSWSLNDSGLGAGQYDPNYSQIWKKVRGPVIKRPLLELREEKRRASIARRRKARLGRRRRKHIIEKQEVKSLSVRVSNVKRIPKPKNNEVNLKVQEVPSSSYIDVQDIKINEKEDSSSLKMTTGDFRRVRTSKNQSGLKFESMAQTRNDLTKLSKSRRLPSYRDIGEIKKSLGMELGSVTSRTRENFSRSKEDLFRQFPATDKVNRKAPKTGIRPFETSRSPKPKKKKKIVGTFGKAKKEIMEEIESTTPGPGHYNPERETIHQRQSLIRPIPVPDKIPERVIPSLLREGEGSPGPAAYNITGDEICAELPGGYKNPNKDKQPQKGFTLGKSPKFGPGSIADNIAKLQDSPGPAKYDIEYYKKETFREGVREVRVVNRLKGKKGAIFGKSKGSFLQLHLREQSQVPGSKYKLTPYLNPKYLPKKLRERDKAERLKNLYSLSRRKLPAEKEHEHWSYRANRKTWMDALSKRGLSMPGPGSHTVHRSLIDARRGASFSKSRRFNYSLDKVDEEAAGRGKMGSEVDSIDTRSRRSRKPPVYSQRSIKSENYKKSKKMTYSQKMEKRLERMMKQYQKREKSKRGKNKSSFLSSTKEFTLEALQKGDIVELENEDERDKESLVDNSGVFETAIRSLKCPRFVKGGFRGVEWIGDDEMDALTPGPGHYNLKSTIPQLQPHEKSKIEKSGWKIKPYD